MAKKTKTKTPVLITAEAAKRRRRTDAMIAKNTPPQDAAAEKSRAKKFAKIKKRNFIKNEETLAQKQVRLGVRSKKRIRKAAKAANDMLAIDPDSKDGERLRSFAGDEKPPIGKSRYSGGKGLGRDTGKTVAEHIEGAEKRARKFLDKAKDDKYFSEHGEFPPGSKRSGRSKNKKGKK